MLALIWKLGWQGEAQGVKKLGNLDDFIYYEWPLNFTKMRFFSSFFLEVLAYVIYIPIITSSWKNLEKFLQKISEYIFLKRQMLVNSDLSTMI